MREYYQTGKSSLDSFPVCSPVLQFPSLFLHFGSQTSFRVSQYYIYSTGWSVRMEGKGRSSVSSSAGNSPWNVTTQENVFVLGTLLICDSTSLSGEGIWKTYATDCNRWSRYASLPSCKAGQSCSTFIQICWISNGGCLQWAIYYEVLELKSWKE